MDITLGEQLLLLSLDDESGAERESTRVAWAIAAASLVELALAGRIDMTDDVVAVRDPSPVGVPAVDAWLAEIAGQEKPERTEPWMRRLLKSAVAGAGDGLKERGLVREEVRKVLGLFPVRRYPEADGSVEAALRERLTGVVLGGQVPDERTAALIGLLHGARLHRLAFPAADRRVVEKSMAEVARGQWAPPAVRRVLDAADVALTVIITGTVAGTTIGGT
ncbi:GOLPH3/VPS74 family protein [Streptomyces specialis]|uniref:GOLPH3/VPS74 family protein n=1 Tax=Streptomyces specialis TaxID=498367 RepID=UPI00073E69C2|nr:GPP34 family phosphoprotein [Streptomyces specialis]